MIDNIKEIAQAMPFIVSAASNKELPKVNGTRITEAIIMAVIAGAVSWFLLIPEMKTEFKYIKRDIGVISSKVEKVEGEINSIKTDIAVERARHD